MSDAPQMRLAPMTWEQEGDEHRAVCPLTRKGFEIYPEGGLLWGTWLGCPLEGQTSVDDLKADAERARNREILPHLTVTNTDLDITDFFADIFAKDRNWGVRQAQKKLNALLERKKAGALKK